MGEKNPEKNTRLAIVVRHAIYSVLVLTFYDAGSVFGNDRQMASMFDEGTLVCYRVSTSAALGEEKK